MWVQFFFENVHFAINLIAALVLFSIFWLYFDAWLNNKRRRELPKLIGLFLLSLSFLVHAVSVETSILPISVLGKNVNAIAFTALVIIGYLLLMFGVSRDPLQAHPKTGGITKQMFKVAIALPTSLSLPLINSIPAIYPMLAALTGFLYLRRATLGYEFHLRKAALGFYLLSLFGLLSLASLFRDTGNVDLYAVVAPFGSLWLLEHFILLAGVLILGRWIWYYLFLRLNTQLFMIFTTAVVAIFLIVTVAFSSLLLRNLAGETLSRLETDVKVLSFAVDSKRAELLADATVVAQNPQVQAALTQGGSPLGEIAERFFDSKRHSFLAIVSPSGEVLGRGEDRERTGGSLSDDPLVKRALAGEGVSAIVTRSGAVAPEIAVRAATPVKRGETLIGAVTLGTTIDNAFVDGVKAATGLEAAVYGNNLLSATTLTFSPSGSRPFGIAQENQTVVKQVLEQGELFVGSEEILNTPYYVAYLPLKDIEQKPVGMLFVGKPQLGVLQTAGRSIELTYIVAALLIVIAVVPAYYISRYLAGQVRT